MAVHPGNKRKPSAFPRAKQPKKVKRQKAYFSSSESEAGENVATDAPISREKPSSLETPSQDGAMQTDVVEKSGKPPLKGILRNKDVVAEDSDGEDSEAEDLGSEHSESDSEEDMSSGEEGQDGDRKKRTKRHDPAVFANSMATILSAKLPVSKRADPVLVRSKQPEEASREIADSKLEARAKRKIRDEKRQAKEKGRVRDVLLGEMSNVPQLADDGDGQGSTPLTAAEVAEQEKRLRKTAQRGVVKLFNAVRAAQVRGEEAARAMREKGVVGQQQREEKVGEMSRQSFLQMISSGKATT